MYVLYLETHDSFSLTVTFYICLFSMISQSLISSSGTMCSHYQWQLQSEFKMVQVFLLATVACLISITTTVCSNREREGNNTGVVLLVSELFTSSATNTKERTKETWEKWYWSNISINVFSVLWDDKQCLRLCYFFICAVLITFSIRYSKTVYVTLIWKLTVSHYTRDLFTCLASQKVAMHFLLKSYCG